MRSALVSAPAGKKRSGITPKRANHKSVPLPGDAFTLDTNATLFSSSQQMQADAAGTPTLAQGTYALLNTVKQTRTAGSKALGSMT